ncbi:hypothetical protein BOO88_10775 [Stutzerimonas stutzeri]|jgi:polysaccharide pyruvyl transferase WcaK-like protein|nr:hypothetical protein BOO89_08120 [Stutzerimonas stutzeri]AZO89386.1 hypothetical protein BOO88_10775 [Stutzerimonas stutzeri]
MKILTLNECLSDNIGDQAIAEAMRQSIQSFGHQTHMQDFSCREQKKTNTTINPSNFKKKIPKLFKRAFFVLKTTSKIFRIAKGPHEIAIIGGGQLILSNSNFSWAMFLWVNALKLFKKKVYILCVGAGSEFSWIDKQLYKNALSKADGLFLRDNQSILTLKKEFNLNASLCPDIAYALYRHPPKQEKDRVCVICITDYSVFIRYHREMSLPKKTEERYLEEWAKITTNYIEQGYKIVLTATTEEDLLQTKKLHKILSSNNSILPTNEVPSVEHFIQLASEADILVAGRMHALILAQIAGATPIPYMISKKIASFSEENLRDNPNEIKNKLEATLAEILSTSHGRP